MFKKFNSNDKFKEKFYLQKVEIVWCSLNEKGLYIGKKKKNTGIGVSSTEFSIHVKRNANCKEHCYFFLK